MKQKGQYKLNEILKKKLQDKYISEGYWRDETFSGMLRECAEKYGNKTALCDMNKSISYSEWNSLADSGAAYLKSNGIKSGDRVIIQIPNSTAFGTALFSLFRLGAVPVLALPTHRKNEISSFINVASPTAYITVRSHLGFDYESMAKECTEGTGCKVFFADEIDYKKFSSDITDFSDTGRTFRDIAVLQVSGGTTNIPKLIPRTNADYLYDSRVFSDVCGMNEDTVFLAAIPASHNFSFANPGLIGTMICGGKIVMAGTGSPDEIFELIDREKVNITAMVPSLLALCSEMSEWEEYELDSLKTVLVGGSLLTFPVLSKAEEALGCKIRQVYGTAEGLNTITDADMSPELTAGCQGKKISAGDEMLIEADDGSSALFGTEGELLLRGPYTIQNYYNNPEADAESFRSDGYYRTGDRAFIDRSGNLHITGRVREQINRAGEKIMPSELERILDENKDIDMSAVVGIPDEMLVNKICAAVVTDNRDITLQFIRGYLEEKGVAIYKLPDIAVRLDCIPLTAVGKPDKKAIVHMIINDLTERI